MFFKCLMKFFVIFFFGSSFEGFFDEGVFYYFYFYVFFEVYVVEFIDLFYCKCRRICEVKVFYFG